MSKEAEFKIKHFLLTLDNTPKGWYVCFAFGMKEVTAMRFKVASRVRGLSDAAFRGAFGTGE